MSGGLDKVGDLPRKALFAGYVEGMGGFTSRDGWYARGEAGVQTPVGIDAFGFGQWDQRQGWNAGIGARWTFGL